MNIPKKISLKTSLIFVVASILITSLVFYAFATTPSSTFYISSGIYPGGPSYTVWPEGSYYFAKDSNGQIDYSGTNATLVIQNMFDQTPQSVFFKGGTYDLDGHTVSCASPVKMCGEGNSETVFEDGTLEITEGAWSDTGTVISDLQFEVEGSRVAIHCTKVINAYIHRVHLTKSSYAPDVPSLWLTSCDTFRIEDNWFDGNQMQILRIDGNESKSLPVHVIARNDFGSTSDPFPAYTDYWEVAAIYIENDTQMATSIKNNVAYLNNENCFVYSNALSTFVVGNQIQCGQGKNAVDLFGHANTVMDNHIDALNNSLAAIRIKGAANDRNLIENNNIYAAANVTCLVGNLYHSVITGNNFYFSHVGLNVSQSGRNIISNNKFINYTVAGAMIAIDEDGPSGYNVIVGNYIGFSVGDMTIIPCATSTYAHNYNYVTENGGATGAIASGATVNHGLITTPTFVVVTTAGTGLSNIYVSAKDATTFTITYVGGGAHVFYWYAEYDPVP